MKKEAQNQVLTLFLVDSLASLTPYVGGENRKTMSGTSGPSARGWSEKLSRVGAFLRTYLESCPLSPTRFVRIWSAKTTLSGYGITKLRLSERRTEERECSLWRTPGAEDPNRGTYSEEGLKRHLARGHQLNLQNQVKHCHLWRTPDAHCDRGAQSKERFEKSRQEGRLLTLNDQVAHMYPTPRSCGGSRSSGMNRSEYYKMWATPKASDAITGTTARTSGRSPEKTTHLAAQVHLCPTPRAADGEKGQRTRQGAEKEANRGHGIDLPLFVQLFPTPTVCGNHNRKGSSAKSGDGLATAVKMLSTPTVNDSKNNSSPSRCRCHTAALDVVAGGSLNPGWVEWLMGFPNGWTNIEIEIPVQQADPADLEWWSVEPEIPRVAKGIPNRVARLRALGNAVVPMQVFPIFRAIAETEACS
jgi:hypothetical protein